MVTNVFMRGDATPVPKPVSALLETVAVAVIFVLIVYLLGPWWDVYKFNDDEGLNLSTAALIADGYQLYQEIWNDQPPLILYMFSWMHQLSPWSVGTLRSIVVIFSGLLLGGMFTLIKRRDGFFTAFVAVILVSSSQNFIQYSVAAMIGNPAISLAILAMALIPGNFKESSRWLFFFSGILFGASLQGKLFTLIFLPIWGLMILGPRSWTELLTELRPGMPCLLIAMAGLISSFIAIAFATGATAIDQVFSIHSQARDAGLFSDVGGPRRLFFFFKQSESVLLFLAIPAMAWTLLKTRGRGLIPICWSLVVFVALLVHRPLWAHHIILLIIPLAWVSAIFLDQIKDLVKDVIPKLFSSYHLVSMVFVLVIGWVGWINLSPVVRSFSISGMPNEAVERVKWFSQGEGLIYTDAPLDAYWSRRQVVPELSLFSHKRISTGNLDDQSLLKIFDQYQPEQISLHRFRHSDFLLEKLKSKMMLTRNYSMRSILTTGRYTHGVGPEIYDASLIVLNNTGQIDEPRLSESRRSLNALMSIAFDIAYISTISGYGGVYFHRFQHRYDAENEGVLLAQTEVISRPPNSAQQIGWCFLNAHRVSGVEVLWDEAIKTARLLACAQRKDGLWAGKSSVSASCLHDDMDTFSETVAAGNASTPGNEKISHSIVQFLNSISMILIEKGENIPEWLDSSLRNAMVNMEGFKQGKDYFSDMVTTHPQLATYTTSDLKENNPDGYQTTKQLVNQCLTAVEKFKNAIELSN